LPALYRIGVLVSAALYALWIVGLERVRWDQLGFRGASGLWPSLVQGAPWIALAVPRPPPCPAALPRLAARAPRPRPRLGTLTLLLLSYASVSVTSQEFLYLSFFFWRYRPLFSPGFLVGLNAVVFGIAHLVYGSWVSVGLALAARVILARVYRRHGSFWGVWILHLLLGVAAFLAGVWHYLFLT